MCEWGRTTVLTLSSGRRIDVDSCIAPVVAALNAGGVETVASCCGHGRRPGRISLTDGRELFVVPDYDAGQVVDAQLDQLGYQPINPVRGETCPDV